MMRPIDFPFGFFFKSVKDRVGTTDPGLASSIRVVVRAESVESSED